MTEYEVDEAGNIIDAHGAIVGEFAEDATEIVPSATAAAITTTAIVPAAAAAATPTTHPHFLCHTRSTMRRAIMTMTLCLSRLTRRSHHAICLHLWTMNQMMTRRSLPGCVHLAQCCETFRW